MRKIIHIDMDAFYASVEQRDNPELHGKPVAVGGSRERGGVAAASYGARRAGGASRRGRPGAVGGGRERGVVAAASYEARRFGVRSAMASVTAKRRCPELIFVKPRLAVSREVSNQIRAIFQE